MLIPPGSTRFGLVTSQARWRQGRACQQSPAGRRCSTSAKTQHAPHPQPRALGRLPAIPVELLLREHKEPWIGLIRVDFSHLSPYYSRRRPRSDSGVCLQLWRRQLFVPFRWPTNCVFPYADGFYCLFWIGWGVAKLEEILPSPSNLLETFFLQDKSKEREKHFVTPISRNVWLRPRITQQQNPDTEAHLRTLLGFSALNKMALTLKLSEGFIFSFCWK